MPLMLSDILYVNNSLLRLLSGMFVVLMIGSVVRIVALRRADPELSASRMGSLKVWWVLAILISIAVIFGRAGTAVLLAVASWLGLREFLALIGTERIGKLALSAAFIMIPLQFLLAATASNAEAVWILPLIALPVLSTMRLLRQGPEDFVRTTAGLYFGVMLLVYGLSHAVLLFDFSETSEPAAGPAGWFLFVLIITEADDIAQALTGRRIGRRRIAPRISPNKTWEGFAGGVAASVILSFILSPLLTTFPSLGTVRGCVLATAAGLIIVTAGFFGDISMSAVKRDVGVKDGSAILPGMGGIIDRVDSLTFTAPAFYFFLKLIQE